MGTGSKFLPSILLTAVLSLPSVGALAQAPHTHQHAFQGAEHWARVFDDPGRDEWQKPQEVIAALDLGPSSPTSAPARATSQPGSHSVCLAAESMPWTSSRTW